MEDETVVSSPVKPNAPEGRYEIRWSVVSADGAPMSGVIRFTLGTAVADINPLDTVLTAADASWVLVGACAVVGALLVYMVYGLITVYGRHEKKAAIGQKEMRHE
ncbi:copper resistance protein CopC [Humibacter ginsengisoli]